MYYYDHNTILIHKQCVSARYISWTFDFFVMLALLVLVLPSYQIHLIVSGMICNTLLYRYSQSGKASRIQRDIRILLLLRDSPFICICFGRLVTPFPSLKPIKVCPVYPFRAFRVQCNWSVIGAISMEMGVGRIGIVGVTVMAFLSGYPLYALLSELLRPPTDTVPLMCHIRTCRTFCGKYYCLHWSNYLLCCV